MSNETNQQYAVRAAVESMKWLTDRTGHCHPIVFLDLDRVTEMLRPYLSAKTLEDRDHYGTYVRKLTVAERRTVLGLLEGFVWAKMERAS